MYGWGRGSGVFLACCEKVILPLKQCRGGGLTPRRSSFFFLNDIRPDKAVCSIPCGHTKFSQPVRAAARFLGPRRHPPHTPHPTQPHQPSTAMRHSTPLRSPRGTFWSLGFAHPWGTSGRQRLRPRHGRRLLRRTGTASSRCSLAGLGVRF